ncbi:cell division protein SepF [Actinomyces sp. oral taxon 414]|jgi:cell division protein sepF|uniref:cell division protein SepF n=1 Tax=Actinomyces sp. oral taxon 414 TaxID=712122 RepID=UPI0006AF47F7|nr:cell division protein SepF [Actinomyces sp. oral taxon 414]ALC98844.1 cell division protein SepF [Actinomyces sp. oral taxon 414]
MSTLRKMTSFLGYAEPTGDDDYEDTYHRTADETYAEEFADGESEQLDDDYDSYEEPDAAAPVAVPDLRRIVTVHPSTYNEARVIGESFRDGVPVIVNLTNMNESDARRMVDFSAGLVFGLHGAIERVTPRVFLLTPASVEIDGGDVAAQTRGRFANQG